MKVLGLRWVGIRSPEYEPMVCLLRDVMGLRVEFSEDTTAELSLPNGDRVQVFAPGDPYYEFFGEHAGGPVPLFEVDDLRAARAELLAARVTLIGGIGHDTTWEWLHFRAPDGNLYELASRRGTTGHPGDSTIG
jgi:catechol 2,3-dioxygenase-like lactoylglutathione lyase family enzyme